MADRGVLTHLFCEYTSLYCLLILFQILSNPPSPILSCRLQPPPPTTHPVVLFLWVNGWSRHIWFYLMISWMCTCQALGPWCVSYATRRQIYWSLTHDVVFYWYSDLMSHTKTHIKKHTAHSGASRLTRPYIFTPTLMCSQQLALLHWMNNLLMSKLHFPQCRFFSKMIHLQKSCCLLIRCYRS